MLLRCAVLCHHVSDIRLSLTLPTGPIPTLVVSQLSLLLNASLYAMYGTGCISDL